MTTAAFQTTKKALRTKCYAKRADLLNKSAELLRAADNHQDRIAAEKLDRLATIASFTDFQEAVHAA
jgi:hypothetical protein